MATLSAKTRKKIPTKEFGLPGEKKYPMEDKSHARDAKARASEMENQGRLSAGSEAKIDAKADKVLGKKKDTHMGAQRRLSAPHKGAATATVEQSATGTGMAGHSRDGHQFDSNMNAYHHDGVEHSSGNR